MKRVALILMLAICTLGSQNAIAATSKSTSKTTKSTKKSRSQSGADFGFKRIGGALQMVGPEEVDATFGFGVFADLGTVAPRWGLEARLDYWSQSEEQFGFEAGVRDIVVGLRTKYDIEVSHPTLRPFVGAGLGMHFLRAEVEVPNFPGPGTTTVDDAETRVGLDFGGGIRQAVSPVVDLHGEAWYSVVPDVNQFSLRVGMSYRLGL
jgi:opacity protein-like surface antigen